MGYRTLGWLPAEGKARGGIALKQPAFGHRMIDSPPHLPAHNSPAVLRYSGIA
jgi:hypothetical protein